MSARWTATAANVSAHSFYDLVINKANPADTVTSTGNWTVTGSLILTQGTWLADPVPSSFTHTIAGAWDSSGLNFTFTSGSSTVVLDPTANPSITTKGIGTDPFYNQIGRASCRERV